jgi:hypothetical protein
VNTQQHKERAMMESPTTAPWMDMTLRPEGDPSLDVNPMTGEVELTWPLANDGGRLTLLIPRKVAERLPESLNDLLVVGA